MARPRRVLVKSTAHFTGAAFLPGVPVSTAVGAALLLYGCGSL
jgi:hypothetical protein